MVAIMAARRGALARLLQAVADFADVWLSALGVDTADGLTSATSVSTLSKAASLLAANKTLGVRRGDVQTLTAGIFLGSALGGCTVKPVGSGARPLVDGGLPITGWAPYATVATNPNLVPNGDCENFSSDARNSVPTGWVSFSGGGSYVSKDTSVKRTGGSSMKLLISGGSLQAGPQMSAQTAGGVTMTVKFWVLGANATDTLAYKVVAGNGTFLQADGSFGASEVRTRLSPTPTTTWTQYTITWVQPYTTACTVLLCRDGATNGTFWTDDWTGYPSVIAPSSPDTYRVAWPPAGTTGTAVSPGVLIESGTWVKRAKGEDINRLGALEWYWEGGFVYMRKAAGPPVATSGSWADRGITVSASRSTLRGVDFHRIRTQAVLLFNASDVVVEDLDIRLSGDQDTSSGNGVFGIAGGARIVVRRVALTDSNSDGFYIANATDVTLEDVSSVMAFGSAGDGLQADYTDDALKQNARVTLRRFFFDQRNSPTPKGCYLSFGDYNVVEDGEVTGGHFGIQDCGSYGATRRVWAHGIEGYGLGATGNGQTITGNTVEDCISAGNDYGIRYWTGTHTAKTVRRVTTTGNHLDGLWVDNVGLTGAVTDSIFWEPTRTGPVLDFTTASPAVTVARCIIGPELPGVPLVRWGGTDYMTLAAWQAASGKGAGCSTADPLFTGVGSAARPWDAYQLQAGSPALTMSATGGRIGCDPAILDPGPKAFPGLSTPAVPRAGGAVRVDATSTTSMDLSWPRVPGALGYRLEYRRATDTAWTALPVQLARYATLTGLPSETAFALRVVPGNALGDGPASAESTGTTAQIRSADAFSAADGTPLAGRVPPNGTLTAPWVISGAGDFQIKTFGFAKVISGNGASFATVDLGTADMRSTGKTKLLEGNTNLRRTGVVARYADPANYLRALAGTQWVLIKLIGGVATTLATGPTAAAADTVEILAQGTTVSLVVNGAVVGTPATVTDAVLASATRAGLYGVFNTTGGATQDQTSDWDSWIGKPL